MCIVTHSIKTMTKRLLCARSGPVGAHRILRAPDRGLAGRVLLDATRSGGRVVGGEPVIGLVPALNMLP
jgi:hypothetical protein